ncbi:MAG TPA: DUF1360 domain-containing protein [Acidimicrobiia bacterium]|jgi:hypothetical protein
MATTDAAHWFEHEAREYSGGNERPLGGYVKVMAVYGASVLGLGALAAATKRPLPERPDARDLGLIALATAKTSRLLTRDAVTSPVRAPFTRFEGPAGPSEVNEEVRGHGAQHAVGELLSCPFCVAQWIGTGFAFGMLFFPRVTRQVAGTFAALEVADLVQFGRAVAEHRAEG